jgi:hypothetical protein
MLRAVLALAAMEDLEVQQLDVKTAFLNGPLQEEIYMERYLKYSLYTFKASVLRSYTG